MTCARTAHKASSPRRTPFENGTVKQSEAQIVPRKIGISHILCDLKFLHMDHYFMEPTDYHDAPIGNSYTSLEAQGR
jgi:hypothetical protein